jgi:hypothetical protein
MDTIHVSRVKLFAEASELFTHVGVQLVVFNKTAFTEGPKDENRRKLNRYCRVRWEEKFKMQTCW